MSIDVKALLTKLREERKELDIAIAHLELMEPEAVTSTDDSGPTETVRYQ